MAIRIGGAVDNACELGFEELASLPEQIDDVSALVAKRSGGAVRMSAVLERAGIRPDATHVTVESSDGSFAASVPLEPVLVSAVLVYREGNAPLPATKGGPMRLLIPDAAACRTAEVDTCSNVKFVGTLTLTAGRGRDTRPSTPRDHKALHDRENG